MTEPLRPAKYGRHMLTGRAGWAATLALMLIAILPAGPARAQDAPYVTGLIRLAEVLGALHHLRPLCGADEPRLWRDKMNNLLVAENPAPDIRQRMVGRFNRSFQDISDAHKTCTPAAQELIMRYLAEGARISDEIVSRYGTTP